MAWKPTPDAFFIWLVGRSDRELSADEVIAWWEGRRLAYNLVVGAAGAITLFVHGILTSVADRPMGGPFATYNTPLTLLCGVLIYGVAANLAYMAGWMAELLVRLFLGPRRARACGRIFVALGFGLSILLTLWPAAVAIEAVIMNTSKPS